MGPKTGRPKSDNPRNEDLNIRLTKTEKTLIKECAEYLGRSRTDTIMEGINRIKAEKDKK
jgi:uncharacterized protein (DUF1778 family)